MGSGATLGRMRQLLRILGAIGLAVAAVACAAAAVATAMLARRWLSERAPRRELDGSGPVIGSFDTWPPVPRAPGAGSVPAAGRTAGSTAAGGPAGG